MLKLLPAVAIMAFACVAVACGGGGDEGKVVIGADGGVVTSGDGKLTLDIPAGALDEEAEITITAVSVDDLPEELREASGPGPAYLLEPDGLEFDEPVAVTLELNRSELDDVPEDGVVAYLLLTQDADGEIESLDELVTEATLGEETITVRGELSHFSWITRTKGPLRVLLQSVAREKTLNSFFTARGRVSKDRGFEHVWIADARGTFLAFGKVSLVTGSMPGEVSHRNAFRSEVFLFAPGEGKEGVGHFRCGSETGIGSYTLIGEGTSTPRSLASLDGDTDGDTNLRVVLDGVVECVVFGPWRTSTPGPATSTPGPATSTPVPPPPTNMPTPSPEGGPEETPTSATTTFTDPTGDEVIIEGGSDAAADIRTVRIGPSASGTRVFVTFGSDPSQHITHFNFVVMITLDGQSGFISFESGSDGSTAPEGGSFAVGVEGVLMVFPGPVPSGARLSVNTIHRETADGHTAIDSFMAIVP